MSFQRLVIFLALLLFGSIGAVSVFKKNTKNSKSIAKVVESKPIEVNLKQLQAAKTPPAPAPQPALQKAAPKPTPAKEIVPQAVASDPLPEIDRIQLLFKKDSQLPFVQTIVYKSKVSWKSKIALPIDYANHYNTPVDFVTRSINERADYTIRNVFDGDRFNVLRTDREFSFYLIIDISRCKLWLYVADPLEQNTLLLKTYHVGLGKRSPDKPSGYLTPLGTYKLGKRVAVFRPKMMGMHKNKRVELIQVFGTRWIPFESEVANCTETARGYGIHGTPWVYDEAKGLLRDDDSSISAYESEGCIRLKAADIEELYSIISTRESMVQIVSDFHEATLPYKERSI